MIIQGFDEIASGTALTIYLPSVKNPATPNHEIIVGLKAYKITNEGREVGIYYLTYYTENPVI